MAIGSIARLVPLLESPLRPDILADAVRFPQPINTFSTSTHGGRPTLAHNMATPAGLIDGLGARLVARLGVRDRNTARKVEKKRAETWDGPEGRPFVQRKEHLAALRGCRPRAFVLFDALARSSGFRRFTMLTNEELGRRLECSIRTIQSALRELEVAGLITSVLTGRGRARGVRRAVVPHVVAGGELVPPRGLLDAAGRIITAVRRASGKVRSVLEGAVAALASPSSSSTEAAKGEMHHLTHGVKMESTGCNFPRPRPDPPSSRIKEDTRSAPPAPPLSPLGLGGGVLA